MQIRACVLVALALIGASQSRALTPDRSISQYGHTAWRVPEDLSGTPLAITQTKDGYIWIGTDRGVLRFDGARFVSLPFFAKYPGLAGWIGAFCSDRDGSLWIGTAQGLFRLKGDEVKPYATGSGGINKIIQDHTGAIWMTRYRVRDGKGPLCRVSGDQLTCYGEKDGVPGSYYIALAEDREGYLWLGSYFVCRWRPGSSQTYLTKEFANLKGDAGVLDIAAGTDNLWLASLKRGPNFGIRVFPTRDMTSAQWKGYVIPGFDGTRVIASSLFVDSHGALWISEKDRGIDRIFAGQADHYGNADGLTNDATNRFLEDREGNLWMITDGGIDRFRDTAVVNYSLREGLRTDQPNALTASRDGSVWVAGAGSLQVIRHDGIYPMNAPFLPSNGSDYYALLEDHSGRLWAAVNDKLLVRSGNQFREVRAANHGVFARDGAVESLAEDRNGDVWVLVYGLTFDSLYLIRGGKDVPVQIPIPSGFQPRQLAASPAGGIWLLSRQAELARASGDRVERVQGNKVAASGQVSMHVDRDDTVWIGTGKGAIWWDGHTDHVLDSRNGLPCTTIRAVIRDAHQGLWLSTMCGLLSISNSEISKWKGNSQTKVHLTVFDALDGARGGSPSEFPRIAETPDGSLWLTDAHSVQRVDPNHLSRNGVVPPVYIEALLADHLSYRVHDSVSLPPLTRDLQISYTALSYQMPQKVRFRYKLEGRDTDWQDPGARREAFYSDLRPGTYTFHVIASNNSGLWNNTGAELPFRIRAAWFQTRWFLTLAVAFGIISLWLLYQLRLRQVAANISARFDERLAERTRLARDLHDTLLQTIQGSKMVADNALDGADEPAELRHALERLAVWLAKAVQEGREALKSLRLSTTETNNLAEGLRRVLEESASDASIHAQLSTKGSYRDMHPIVRDEIFRMGNEAIRNACMHSGGSRVEVELIYGSDLSLTIRDNGVGMDPKVAAEGKASHFGLQGMRERALRIRAKLNLKTSPNLGTEVQLLVPGSVIYLKSFRGGERPKPPDHT